MMTKELSRPAQAAKSMKAELTAKWPHVKFSAKSEQYSMGNNVNVRWAYGPTTKQVKAITDKYQEGDFDGMVDMYEHRKGREQTKGSAKYVFENRDYTEPLFTQIARDYAVLLGAPLPDGTPPWNHRIPINGQIPNGYEWLATLTNQLLAVFEFPAGWTYQGIKRVEGVTAGHGWDDFYEIVGAIRHARY